MSVPGGFMQEGSCPDCSLHTTSISGQGTPRTPQQPTHANLRAPQPGAKAASASAYLWAGVRHEIHARGRGQSDGVRADGGCDDPVGRAQRAHRRPDGVHGGRQRPGGICGCLEVVVVPVHRAARGEARGWAHGRGAGVNGGICRRGRDEGHDG